MELFFELSNPCSLDMATFFQSRTQSLWDVRNGDNEIIHRNDLEKPELSQEMKTKIMQIG